MQIYNAGGMDHTSRFILTLIVGLFGALGLGILYGIVQSLLRIEFEYIFLLIGWLIGEMVRKLGHGVSKKFNILGAVLAAIAVFTGDVVVRYGISGVIAVFTSPGVFTSVLAGVLNSFRSVWGIFGVLFRVMAIYLAYQRSTIL